MPLRHPYNYHSDSGEVLNNMDLKIIFIHWHYDNREPTRTKDTTKTKQRNTIPYVYIMEL